MSARPIATEKERPPLKERLADIITKPREMPRWLGGVWTDTLIEGICQPYDNLVTSLGRVDLSQTKDPLVYSPEYRHKLNDFTWNHKGSSFMFFLGFGMTALVPLLGAFQITRAIILNRPESVNMRYIDHKQKDRITFREATDASGKRFIILTEQAAIREGILEAKPEVEGEPTPSGQ